MEGFRVAVSTEERRKIIQISRSNSLQVLVRCIKTHHRMRQISRSVGLYFQVGCNRNMLGSDVSERIVLSLGYHDPRTRTRSPKLRE